MKLKLDVKCPKCKYVHTQFADGDTLFRDGVMTLTCPNCSQIIPFDRDGNLLEGASVIELSFFADRVKALIWNFLHDQGEIRKHATQDKILFIPYEPNNMGEAFAKSFAQFTQIITSLEKIEELKNGKRFTL